MKCTTILASKSYMINADLGENWKIIRRVEELLSVISKEQCLVPENNTQLICAIDVSSSSHQVTWSHGNFKLNDTEGKPFDCHDLFVYYILTCCGLMIFVSGSSSDSLQCAKYPAMRGIANKTGKNSVGNPIALIDN